MSGSRDATKYSVTSNQHAFFVCCVGVSCLMKGCKVSCHTDDILHHIGVKLHYLGVMLHHLRVMLH
jgi:hypothetical protein